MRLHVSESVQFTNLYEAETEAHVSVDWTPHGSRSAHHAFEVRLTGWTSNRWANTGNTGAGADHAATWDEWGIFLGHLYAIDPDMSCWAYRDRMDFDQKTGHRFDYLNSTGLAHADQHINHRWTSENYISVCAGCSAWQDHTPVAS